MLEEEAIQNESITSIPHDRDFKTKHYSDFLQYLDSYYCDTTSFDVHPLREDDQHYSISTAAALILLP